MRSLSCLAAVALLSACGQPEEPQVAPDAGAAVVEPSPHVGGLALAVASDGGVMLAHVRHCEDCTNSKAVEISAVDPTVEAAEGSVMNPLFEESGNSGDNPLFEGRNDRLIGGAAGGGRYWFAFVDAQQTVHALVGGLVPGGGIVSAAVSSVSASLDRQTPSTSFGGMVRKGQLLATDDGSLLVLGSVKGSSNGALALTSFNPEGTEARKDRPFPSDASAGVFAQAQGVTVFATSPKGGGLTSVQVGDAAPVTAPVSGVPAALWTNGTTFKVALKKSDSIAMLWDGKSLLDLPRTDEVACSALAFTEKGELFMLHAGPRSSVLYGQQDGSPVQLRTVLSTRPDGARETRGCALEIQGTTAHVAWVEEETFILYEQWDLATQQSKLKTKHDTAKNSVGNIR